MNLFRDATHLSWRAEVGATSVSPTQLNAVRQVSCLSSGARDQHNARICRFFVGTCTVDSQKFVADAAIAALKKAGYPGAKIVR